MNGTTKRRGRPPKNPAPDDVEAAERRNERPTVQSVEAAMDVLLSKRQIAAVKSRTFRGPSKVQTIRRLLQAAIDEDDRVRAEIRAGAEKRR